MHRSSQLANDRVLLDGVLAHCDGVVKLLKSDIIQVGSMDFVYNIYKYAGESGWEAKNVAEWMKYKDQLCKILQRIHASNVVHHDKLHGDYVNQTIS